MQNRGLLFSVMVFLLLSAVLSLQEASSDRHDIIADSVNESAVYRKVSDKLANIKNNTIVLTTNKSEREIDERVLPFSYTIDSNTFTVSTEFPLRQSALDAYLENLNAFLLFLEDTNSEREFDSMNVDINTLSPASWGGSDNNISFLIQPGCVRLLLADSAVEFEVPCDSNYLIIRKHDFNISFLSAHDFNVLACSFNGSSSCPSQPYDPSNPLPYFDVNLDTAQCPACSLGQTAIRGHFDPAMQSSLTLTCSGSACKSPQLQIALNNLTSVSYSGQRFNLAIAVTLASSIREAAFADLNVSVENKFFGVRACG